jgi:hypothetical protein
MATNLPLPGTGPSLNGEERLREAPLFLLRLTTSWSPALNPLIDGTGTTGWSAPHTTLPDPQRAGSHVTDGRAMPCVTRSLPVLQRAGCAVVASRGGQPAPVSSVLSRLEGVKCVVAGAAPGLVGR